MKYIITENRLNDIIFKYLDVKYGALEQKRGEYSDIVFAFPDEEDGVLGWSKSRGLYVYYELRNEISDYFGLNNVDSIRIISKWVEDRYHLKVIDDANSQGVMSLRVKN